MEKEIKQQKLREWILTQPYFSLNAKYDGWTAWEIAGKILEVIEEKYIDCPNCGKCQMECDNCEYCGTAPKEAFAIS